MRRLKFRAGRCFNAEANDRAAILKDKHFQREKEEWWAGYRADWRSIFEANMLWVADC